MHKLRIVGTESGKTQGTEVWLDDRRLEGVTGVHLGIALNSVCHADISIHVCNVVVEGTVEVERHLTGRLDPEWQQWMRRKTAERLEQMQRLLLVRELNANGR